MEALRQALAAAAPAFPLPDGVRFAYGTAGFRTLGEQLPGVAFRMGLYSAMRARKEGLAAGVMLSASHNPGRDNGFKLIDCSGAMLPVEWERPAEEVANARSAEEIAEAMGRAAERFSAQPHGPAVVHVGRDTRDSGPALLAAFLKGIEVAGASAVDHGVVTTPQLHWLVWQANARGSAVCESDYYDAVCAAYGELTSSAPPKAKVYIDCSNGVGFPQMSKLSAQLQGRGLGGAGFELRNGETGDAEKLNALCGADFVQKEKAAPLNFALADFSPESHCASYDGDADRLVYFYPTKEGRFALLDGDRIIALFAALIGRFLKQVDGLQQPPRVGVVQTAYANGASTRYIKETLGLEVACVPTGVKHLHHKAMDYDVGIYFEANGHGSVVFSDALLAALAKASGPGAGKLLALSRLVNPVCGDAMADLLMCEVALSELGWGIPDWAATYTDAPSRMTKVTVPDPQRVQTEWDQRRATAPDGLQAGIDECVARHNARAPGSSRAFVRPSGTEPIVRVYAESDTQECADALAREVEEVCKRVLG